MDFLIASAYAQDGGQAGPSAMQPLIMMLIFIAVFYFLLIRPQMKRAKEHRTMVSQLAKGDEVLDRKSTRLNSSHNLGSKTSRIPSSA